MSYLIFVYLAFSIVVILRQEKSPNLLWFLMMPVGFSLALFGLMLFTEFIAYANFTENPLFNSGNLLVWKVNYYLDLSVFEMFRFMNLGIALYILGAIGFPLSQQSNRLLLRKGVITTMIPALFIVLSDPELLQWIFTPDSAFQGMQNVLSGLNVFNRVLNYLVKAALISSLGFSVWFHLKTPRVFRKRSQLIILGIAPIHALVFVLFYWFPGHSIHIWRLATLKMINLPYTQFTSSLVVMLSFISIGVLIYLSIVYNSFELNARMHRLGFRARMNTAGSGLRIFAHSIKNQFIAIKLLSEQDSQGKESYGNLGNIISICEKSIQRLSSLPILPSRVTLEYKRIPPSKCLNRMKGEFPEIELKKPVPAVYIRVDEHYFMEVLRNLVVNSREALQGRDSPRIILGCERQLNYIAMYVQDNGCGIVPEKQKHIFEPFFSTKPSITNWGMGLAFSRQIMEAFGGSLHLESSIDGYTRFTMYLPEESDGE
jgi:signal transduction histidine kinase